MGKIIISANCSSDGVVQDPDGAEGFAHGGWFLQAMGNDRGAWAQNATAEVLHADALLLGRTTDAWFGARYPARDGELADRMNSMPKYVVSSTLEQPAWSNATLLEGDPITAVTKLKGEIEGEILVYGSIQLGQALMKHDLVDEVRLTVMPVLVGEGVRLFGDTGGLRPLRLLSTKALGENIVFSDYEVVREA